MAIANTISTPPLRFVGEPLQFSPLHRKVINLSPFLKDTAEPYFSIPYPHVRLMFL